MLSSHAVNELIDPVAVTFTYDCSTNQLAGSPALTHAALTYSIQASATSPAVSDTTTVN